MNVLTYQYVCLAVAGKANATAISYLNVLYPFPEIGVKAHQSN